jgi:hypothetical protein
VAQILPAGQSPDDDVQERPDAAADDEREDEEGEMRHARKDEGGWMKDE